MAVPSPPDASRRPVVLAREGRNAMSTEQPPTGSGDSSKSCVPNSVGSEDGHTPVEESEPGYAIVTNDDGSYAVKLPDGREIGAYDRKNHAEALKRSMRGDDYHNGNNKQ